MPHVWVKRLNEKERPIIVNIWDLPQSRDKSSSMIPNNKIDHFIIVYDPYYRSLFQSKNKYFISLETLIEECPGPLTIIIHGNGKAPMNIPRHINLIVNKPPSETAGLVRDISTRVYGLRVAHIDKQISELLLKTEKHN
jgi:hypothetical protein